jgi:CRP-like cAMP-binding protein
MMGDGDQPRFVLSGWVGLARHLMDGRRQIVDLFLPGDLITHRFGKAAHAKASYLCLTRCIYADASELMSRVAANSGAYPHLAERLIAAGEEMDARLVDQIVRTGRMAAHERLADFAIALYRRLDRVGLCSGTAFPMPLTQEVIADVLGMSTVHVNRTLQQLRREQSLRAEPGRWQIADMARLEEVAGGAHGRHIARDRML